MTAYLGLQQEVISFTDSPGCLFDLEAAFMALDALLGLLYCLIQDLDALGLV